MHGISYFLVLISLLGPVIAFDTGSDVDQFPRVHARAPPRKPGFSTKKAHHQTLGGSATNSVPANVTEGGHGTNGSHPGVQGVSPQPHTSRGSDANRTPSLGAEGNRVSSHGERGASPHFQVINAPNPWVTEPSTVSIFLSGSIARNGGDWRKDMAKRLSHLPVTLINPDRPDWDPAWTQDINCAPLRHQVEWELDGMERADIVAVYFDPSTQAPVTLLELGLLAGRRPKKTICGVPEGYFRRGNVQVVNTRYGVEMVDGLDELVRRVEERAKVLIKRKPSRISGA